MLTKIKITDTSEYSINYIDALLSQELYDFDLHEETNTFIFSSSADVKYAQTVLNNLNIKFKIID